MYIRERKLSKGEMVELGPIGVRERAFKFNTSKQPIDHEGLHFAALVGQAEFLLLGLTNRVWSGEIIFDSIRGRIQITGNVLLYPRKGEDHKAHFTQNLSEINSLLTPLVCAPAGFTFKFGVAREGRVIRPSPQSNKVH